MLPIVRMFQWVQCFVDVPVVCKCSANTYTQCIDDITQRLCASWHQAGKYIYWQEDLLVSRLSQFLTCPWRVNVGSVGWVYHYYVSIATDREYFFSYRATYKTYIVLLYLTSIYNMLPVSTNWVTVEVFNHTTKQLTFYFEGFFLVVVFQQVNILKLTLCFVKCSECFQGTCVNCIQKSWLNFFLVFEVYEVSEDWATTSEYNIISTQAITSSLQQELYNVVSFEDLRWECIDCVRTLAWCILSGFSSQSRI